MNDCWVIVGKGNHREFLSLWAIAHNVPDNAPIRGDEDCCEVNIGRLASQ